MLRSYLTLLTLLMASLLSGCRQPDFDKVQQQWAFRHRVEVVGRQGVACLKAGVIVSSNRLMVRYNRDGEEVARNASPFSDWLPKANHLGDIDVLDGVVYGGVERFKDGRGHHMHVARYDADTLRYKSSFPVAPESGQKELSGVAADPVKDLLWLSDWSDGAWLYRYQASTGAYLGKMGLAPALVGVQGLTIDRDGLLLAADDGDADHHQPDHVWRVSPRAGEGPVKPTSILALTDVVRSGEIEGLCVTRDGAQLVVAHNRGTRIVGGKFKGLYPGYSREFSELHVYRR